MLTPEQAEALRKEPSLHEIGVTVPNRPTQTIDMQVRDAYDPTKENRIPMRSEVQRKETKRFLHSQRSGGKSEDWQNGG